jgi:arsenate reductase (thioredoxin)
MSMREFLTSVIAIPTIMAIITAVDNLLSIRDRPFRTFTDTRRAASIQYGLHGTDPAAVTSLSGLPTRRVHAGQQSRQRVAKIGSLVILGVAIALSTALTQQCRSTMAEPSQQQPTVLFICPHGAAKSVLASAYFQKAARERGLNVRVETAGVEPQDAVSPAVKAHLERNGYTVPVTRPRAVTKADLTHADVVISLGCDLSQLPAAPRSVQKWDEVPGPTEDLKGADEQIRRRVMALVEELVARQKQ